MPDQLFTILAKIIHSTMFSFFITHMFSWEIVCVAFLVLKTRGVVNQSSPGQPRWCTRLVARFKFVYSRSLHAAPIWWFLRLALVLLTYLKWVRLEHSSRWKSFFSFTLWLQAWFAPLCSWLNSLVIEICAISILIT